MKKLYIKKEKQEIPTTSEPTKFCGFTINTLLGDEKGYLVHIGSNKLKAIMFQEGMDNCNFSYGLSSENVFDNVEDFLSTGLSSLYYKDYKIYFFDSLRELHEWLLEK